MKKITLLVGLTAVLGTAALAAAPGTSSAKPNILFVFADQLRASATGYAGDPNVRTPNLDTLAKQGLNFRNAVSVCPVCTPYRAALITGRFPTTTGMFLNDAHLPDAEVSIAEALKPAGYDTAYIGKWHIDGHGRSSYIPPERRQGFDYWKVAECDHNYNHSHYYTGNFSQKQFWEGYDAFAQTKDAQQYLRDHAQTGKPFCLFLSYGIPHFPHHTAPAQLKALYPPDKIKLPPNVPADLQTEAVRTEAQGYYAHVTALDQCIGDLTRTLAELGLQENTILVFTSDHGEMMGAQGVRPSTKQVVYDEAAHVPFLLRYPKAHGPAGHAVFTPLTTPDIMPTLLGLAGVPVPAAVEGKDLSGLIVAGEKELPEHDALYMGVSPFANGNNNTPYRAIRTSRYTYARRLQGPWVLFDDRNDPFQTNNLVTQPAQAALVREMDERLQSALKAVHDDFRPPAYYVEKFGYELAPHGSVSYAPGAKVQSPKPQAAAPRSESAAPFRPNILWLISEDTGPEVLSRNGTPQASTPNLDKLAQQGVYYSHVYNGMVCSVSRSSFMTGMHAVSLGTHNHRSNRDGQHPLPEGVRVLTDWLRDAGYFTANVVKLPDGMGFKGAGKTDWNFTYKGQPFDSADWSELRSHQPFYAQVNFQETHRAYHAPAKADPAKVVIPPYYPDHPVTRKDWAAYLDSASELDRKIGLVLQQLEKDGLADNTVVMYFGDNGASMVRAKQFCYEESFHVPLIIRWPKNFPVPRNFRVGSTEERFIDGIDFAPTMMDIAGAHKPAKMQGRNFLGERAEPPREYVFGSRDRCDDTAMRIRSVRDARYRYIHNFTPETPFLAPNNYKETQYPVWNLLKELHAEGKLTPAQEFLCQPRMPDEELYDLTNDPYQVHNLATSSDPAAQAALKRLRGVLDQWMVDVDDKGRVPEDPAAALGKGVQKKKGRKGKKAG